MFASEEVESGEGEQLGMHCSLFALPGGRRGDLGLGGSVHLGIAQDVEHEQDATPTVIAESATLKAGQ